jgi:parafibromin
MAESLAAVGDPLLQLRQSIANSSPPILTTSSSADNPTEDLAAATHLTFTLPTPTSFPLSIATRFISSEKPVDLRSIYFAWQHKDDPIPEYISSAQALNDALAAITQNANAKVQNLVFVERLDLITWLEGSSDDSEYIKTLESDGNTTAQAVGTAQLVGSNAVTTKVAGVRTARNRNPVLQAIYNNERRIGDRNSVLRGIKPTVSFKSPLLLLLTIAGLLSCKEIC